MPIIGMDVHSGQQGTRTRTRNPQIKLFAANLVQFNLSKAIHQNSDSFLVRKEVKIVDWMVGIHTALAWQGLRWTSTNQMCNEHAAWHVHIQSVEQTLPLRVE